MCSSAKSTKCDDNLCRHAAVACAKKTLRAEICVRLSCQRATVGQAVNIGQLHMHGHWLSAQLTLLHISPSRLTRNKQVTVTWHTRAGAVRPDDPGRYFQYIGNLGGPFVKLARAASAHLGAQTPSEIKPLSEQWRDTV